MLEIHGISRTRPRVALLKHIAVQLQPVTVGEMLKVFSGQFDEATIYRALEKFREHKILVRYDFGHDHAYYEIAHEKPHHHHAICESCGKVEDIRARDMPKFDQLALKDAPNFATFTRHSLEFYGHCKACADVN